MLRSLALRIVSKVRRLNRAWIDRLDPDWPQAAADPPPASSSGPRQAAPAPETRKKPAGPIDIMPLTTPNPDALKFSCSVPVSAEAQTWVSGQKTTHPIGSRLLEIPEVASAFAVGDFVTVTRVSGADWNLLEGRVVQAIRQGLSE